MYHERRRQAATPVLIAAIWPGLLDELQPSQIVLRPAGVLFDHATQRFAFEGIAWGVKRHGDPTTVAVIVNLMGTGAAVKREAIPDQSGYYFAGG
jgi:hypothetical protein